MSKLKDLDDRLGMVKEIKENFLAEFLYYESLEEE